MATRQYGRMTDSSEEVVLTWLNERVQRMARASGRHPLLVDLAIELGLAAVSLGGLETQDRLGPVTAIFCVALCVPLALRRRSPFACFAMIALVAFLQWLLAPPQIADAAVLFSLYWVALEADVAKVALAAVVVEAGAVMAAVRWSPSDPVKIWVGLSGLTVAAGVLGITVRQRRDLLVSLREKAARLELERDQEGRLGAAAERARIAREMHDIVSHNLTVMIALADGATYAIASSPERALPAMEGVSTTGRQALVEMRLLGVLHDEPAEHPLEPQPSLDRLDDLLARVHAAGIPVTVELDGDPHQLPDGIQLAVFRIAQEALTNTLKHAVRPTRAHLLLRCRAGQVELEVTDSVSANAPEINGHSAIVSGGRGLRGMRERAAAYGGELDAGPLPQGGWRVHLQLDPDTRDGAG
jgi:signal transduction histidine kinase